MKWRLLALAIPVLAFGVFQLGLVSHQPPPEQVLAPSAPRPPSSWEAESAAAADGVPISTVPFPFFIDSGENLGSILAGLNLDAQESHAITAALAEFVDLRRLRPGDAYTAYMDPSGRTKAFELTVENRGEVRVTQVSEGEWVPEWR